MGYKNKLRCIVGGAAMLASASSMALTLNFDYSYDTNNFFSTPVRKSVLEAAGGYFESILNDQLTAITSGGGNSFNAYFFNPATGANATINNFSVAANALTIFVGGRNLSGSTLGEGGPGAYSASGSQAFLNSLDRGQTGVGTTDFAPWGGAITFDSNSVWYFDTNTATIETFSGQNDFYSVALHEIGHVLGIGTADSWFAQIDYTSNQFTGAASVAAFGGNVPLSSDQGHWANGTQSTVGGVPQEAAMDPSITTGTRKVFTALDNAALSDVGWEVSAVPLPAAVWLFGAGLVGLFGVARRKAA